MFNRDFYPTPKEVFNLMVEGYNLENKTILEPSAGKGNIIEYCQKSGASEIISCEIVPDLITILKSKSNFLKPNFLEVTAEEISHIDFIIMNPPFTEEERHLLHAYEIAPAGCTIISLCNYSLIENKYSRQRKEIVNIIEAYGSVENLGPMFENSERSTSVEIGLIKVFKPGETKKSEFEGFFMDEQEDHSEAEGVIKYDFLRDLVNRYTQAVKIYDKQLQAGREISNALGTYFKYGDSIVVNNENEYLVKRLEFKKSLQKSGWNTIFTRLNLEKYSTSGVMQDINKFIEQQSNVPFTMKNIYKMLEIIIGTSSQRMDKALEEVFDKCTRHTKDNQYNVEGWATNSHYLLNKKFIVNDMVTAGFRGEVSTGMYSRCDKLEDMQKALCFLTGKKYEGMIKFYDFIRYQYKLKDNEGNYIKEGYSTIMENEKDHICREADKIEGSVIEDSRVTWGEWIEWGFFRIKCHKKGTVHLEFLDADVWGLFNQNIARIKGFPLYEYRPKAQKPKQETKKASVIFEFSV